jgi:hypothetical protein
MLVAIGIAALGCTPGRTEFHTLPTTQITGRLDGAKINDGLTDCVWLVSPAGQRTYLYLPDSIRVEFDPLRLRSASGAPIANGGEIVTVTGPNGTVGETICAPGATPFEVETIVRGTGRAMKSAKPARLD